MACESYRLLISASLDGELTQEETAALRAHLSECAACRAALEEQQMLHDGLRALEEEPPARVAEGVMATLYAKKKRRFFAGPGTLIGAAAAVLVLLAAYGKLPFLSRQPERNAVPVQAEPAQPAAPVELPPATFSAAAPTSDAGGAQTPAAAPQEKTSAAPAEAPVEAPMAPAEAPAVGAAIDVSDAETEPEALYMEAAVDGAAEPMPARLEIYNYSDGLPIEELEALEPAEQDGNYLYDMTVAEAQAIYERYLTTHTMYFELPEDSPMDGPAQVVVMP